MSSDVKVTGNLKNTETVFERLRTLAGLQVVVGVPEGVKGTNKKGEPYSMGEIAAVLCFGSLDGDIPSRPFLRRGMKKATKMVTKIYTIGLRGIVKGNLGVHQVLELIGLEAVKTVKAQITDGRFIANSPITIKRKGSSRPLIDTSQLMQSVTHVIEPLGTPHEDAQKVDVK